MILKQGDICTYKHSKGTWGFFWILNIDDAKIGKVYSLTKFDTNTDREILASQTSDIEELKNIKTKGHFPISEKKVLEVEPKVIGYNEVKASDLDGYNIWKEAFEKGKAGVFTIPIEQISF